jgi:hypothetical protein
LICCATQHVPIDEGDTSRHNNLDGANGGTTNEHAIGQLTFDPKVQIHILVNEAFARYDGMQQAHEE